MKIPMATAGLMVLLLLPLNLNAQSFSYRTYDMTNGLPGNYLNAVGQDAEGFLWIGLETGIYRFDGISYQKIELKDTLTTGYPSAFYCDPSGVMWIGYTDGSLYTWTLGSDPVRQDIEADRINRIVAGPDGKSWVITQSMGIYRASAAQKMEKLTTPEGILIFDIAFVGKDSALVATQDNLYICKIREDQVITLKNLPELEYVWIQSLATLAEDKWAAGTDGSGLFIVSRKDGSFSAAPVTGYQSLEGVRIPSVLTGDNNTLFVATRESGMIKLGFNNDYSSVESIANYDAASGLSDNDVRTLFKDREGNLWIGLFNLGLAALTTNAFSFYCPVNDKEITFIGEAGGTVVLGTRNGIYDFNSLTGVFSNYREIKSKTGGSGITAWKSGDDGIFYVGTENDGLWLMSKTGALRSWWRSGNPGQNHINSIETDHEYIWLATLNGVVLLDRKSGRMIKEYTTWDKLPHNNIAQVKSIKEGEVLVATETDKLCFINIESGVRTEGLLMEGSRKNKILSLSCNGGSGMICAGTDGNGLFRFEGDTLMNIMTYDGLKSNYCYSVLIASDKRIWVGHERGFSLVNTNAGFIREFGREFGVKGDCLPNAITETSDGHIYIGTTEGIISYDPAMERENPVPPQAAVVSVKFGNVEFPDKESYTLPFRSSTSVQVTYAGISLSDPNNVSFRVKLEGLEDWGSPTEERTMIYPTLGYGSYRFVVEASAKDDPDATTTDAFDLVIQKPVFIRWWFILSMFIIAAVIVYLIILLRERNLRKQQEYLEEELRKRTAEVMEQKEELQQKNQDITESIKYAKRIQNSILPDINRLSTVFSEAFVFFLPRDIVSGDFFWFDWVDKEKFIVVCADSTGHGVPGSFMSMIGSALLQDIITRKKIVKPSQVLLELDKRIFSTLNQNQEVEAANDGMDIIVCEFNVKTRHLVFASAMRPVILIIDGEQQYIRGNRSSVGGESAAEKFYDDQEYHLREGDTIYLFSDGYPDQFGGIGSKKMKISRLRTLIDDIKALPLAQQQQKIKDYFFEWKGDNEQVDDVLLMGIRV